tara:strand:- start:8 stop:280 length:273 start_codon:yes stop_codon:yes gene_type:complete
VSEEKKQVIYAKNNSKYNVNNFTDEAKISYAYIIEINQEIMALTKRITILQAASVTLGQKIDDQLTSDMVISDDDDEAVNKLTDNDHLGY